eukprot:scaffold12434_cov177-Amphora_coffeaeformis.AAC.3
MSGKVGYRGHDFADCGYFRTTSQGSRHGLSGVLDDVNGTFTRQGQVAKQLPRRRGRGRITHEISRHSHPTRGMNVEARFVGFGRQVTGNFQDLRQICIAVRLEQSRHQ